MRRASQTRHDPVQKGTVALGSGAARAQQLEARREAVGCDAREADCHERP